jgi:hypothetical protein
MLFNKKDKPENDSVLLVFPASAGNALQKILQKKLADCEKQKIDIVSNIQQYSLTAVGTDQFYESLLAVRNWAIDAETLLVKLAHSRKDDETNLLIVETTKQEFGNLAYIIAGYREKCLREFNEFHDTFNLGNTSFQELVNGVEEHTKYLRYAIQAEEIIEKTKEQL